MASVALSRQTNRSISVDEATQQFDRLFDEYFDVAQPAQRYRTNASCSFGLAVLDSNGSEEFDEVHQDSQSDPKQKEIIHQVAEELAKLGDKYSEKFENDFLGSRFEYQTFHNTVESIMAHDKNVANFVFMMCLSKRVVGKVGSLADTAKSFFRRYIGESYVPVVAEAGGVQQFMGQSQPT